MFITWFLFTEIEQSQFRKVRLLLHAVTHTKITVCHLCRKNQYFQLTFFSLSLSNSTRSASPKAPSEFPTPKPIPDGEILERVTSIARSMKRRRELPSQKNMVSNPSYTP